MLKRRLHSQSGQALVIAVLLLILMAILAAIFVAFVAHSVSQAGRRVDVEAAERMSVAGVLFAQRQLQTSPAQASWRPDRPAYYNPLIPGQYYNDAELARGFHLSFPPFVKMDDPVVAGDNPFSMGSAGEEQRGRCLLQVSYVPSYYQYTAAPVWGTWTYPTDNTTGLFDELSPFIKVTAVGSAREAPELMRTKVAFIPLVLPDRLETIVDAEETYRWASYGAPPWVDINGDGLLDGWSDTDGDGVCDPPDGLVADGEEREFPVARALGGFHSNTATAFYGRTWFGELAGDRSRGVGGFGRGDRITTAGWMAINNPPLGQTPPADWDCGARFGFYDALTASLLMGAVYPSREPLGGGSAATWDRGAALPNTPSWPGPDYWFPTFGGYVADNAGLTEPAVDDAARIAGIEIDTARRVSQRVRAGLLDAADAAGNVRLRTFARESGYRFEILAGSGTPTFGPGVYNTAQMGLGNTVYVDNGEDVQALDPQALHDNWIRAGAQANAFWYGPVYVPPGCEVILHETDLASDWIASPPTWPAAGAPPQAEYGNLPELPDIEIYRNPTPSGAARFFSLPVVADSNGDGLASPGELWNPTMAAATITAVLPLDVDPNDGIPDDHIVVDYPADGCLYFEGNVRVRGKLPISRVDVLDAAGYPRRYDLSLVCRESIYVDGNLMRGLDWLPVSAAWLDGSGVLVSGPAGAYPEYVVQDRYCARVALLAEHNVVVNATRGEYQGPGIQTDCEYIPDVAESANTGGHWLLEPGRSFRTYFGFGGIDMSNPDWGTAGPAPPDNPMSADRQAITGWSDDMFLKVRVRGSRFTPFNLLINGRPYDFDTRPENWSDGANNYVFAEAPGISPCRQMSGNVETLCIPLLIAGQSADAALSGAGVWDAQPIAVDGLAGDLNSVEIRPAAGMTAPLEIYGISLERREGTGIAPAALPGGSPTPPGTASGIPLLASDVAHPWFAWSPEQGPPPLVRGGGDVLHSRVMTVAACCYAQKGSFALVGGDYFDRDASQTDRDGDNRIIADSLGVVDNGVWRPSDVDLDRSGTPDWAESRRHNLQVQILGAVVENLPPDMTCVADWTDKLSFPVPDMDTTADQDATGYAPTFGFWTNARVPTGWCGPVRAYDPGLRACNPVDLAAGPLAPGIDTTQTVCRFSRLPVSPDLIYFGDLTQ